MFKLINSWYWWYSCSFWSLGQNWWAAYDSKANFPSFYSISLIKHPLNRAALVHCRRKCSQKNYYEVLGLDATNCTEKDIRDAFVELSKKVGPTPTITSRRNSVRTSDATVIRNALASSRFEQRRGQQAKRWQNDRDCRSISHAEQSTCGKEGLHRIPQRSLRGLAAETGQAQVSELVMMANHVNARTKHEYDNNSSFSSSQSRNTNICWAKEALVRE